MKVASPLLAATKLQRLSRLRPKLGIVLGTGFCEALRALETDARVAYERIPGFPPVGVSGHPGEAVIGRLGGSPVILLRGRTHFYEGHPMTSVTFAVRALAAYGVRDLLLTNAAGGINTQFRAGEFMILKDHINLMGTNPLCGAPASDATRFLDLSCVYDPGLRQLLRRAGEACGLRLRSGVYLAVTGPSYETPAEIRAFRMLGADAVGMSTVPEAIVARQCGLGVAAVSCITNLASGLNPTPLSHREVLETARQVKHAAGQILVQFALLHATSLKIRIEKKGGACKLDGGSSC